MEGKKSASDVDPDPSLDFLSAKFDPLLALRVVSTDIKMPCPDVQACYSLDAYKSIMRARWSGSGIRDAIDQRASAGSFGRGAAGRAGGAEARAAGDARRAWGLYILRRIADGNESRRSLVPGPMHICMACTRPTITPHPVIIYAVMFQSSDSYTCSTIPLEHRLHVSRQDRLSCRC